MSSGNKSLASSGGRGTSKNKSSHGSHGKTDHHHQSKSSDSSKHDKGQQNKDQSRHAQIIDTRMGGTEDPVLKEQIKQVMDMTRRSEDEVIMALHDSDGDLDRAVNDLLEGVQTEWEVKKKKARQPGGSKQNADQSGDVEETGDWEERRNQRGGGPPRLRGRANHDNRGWRGRENKENERNMEDNVREGGYGGARRGGRGGPGRSGRGGRGGGRGLGPRTFANRGDVPSSSSAHSFSRPIDTWTGSEEQQQSNQEPKMDAWNNLEPTEDWDNEEYTGSLADTKVFTPSTSMTENTSVTAVAVDDESKQVQEVQQLVAQSSAQNQPNLVTLQQEESSKLSEATATLQSQQQTSLHQQQQAPSVLGITGQLQQQLTQQQQPSIVGGAALTAAQSQYLTQLTQQSSENFKSPGQSAFSSMTMTSQPQRQTKQRPRVPPPSKIPSSAVEMPGDTVNSNIGFLDVQFGALELCSDSASLDGSATDKYNSSSTSISGIDISSSSTSAASAAAVAATAAATAAAVAASTAANSSTSSNSLDIETPQQTTGTNQCFNANSQMVSPSNASVAYGTTTSYTSSQKPSYQASNAAPSSYNAYSSSSGQTGQSSNAFPTASGGSANNYTTTTSVTQASYNASSTYPQSNASSYSQASPSASTGGSASSAATSAYNQTTTANQAYQSSASGFVPSTTAQYQTGQSSTSNVGVTNNSNTGGYQASSYQGSSSFQSTPQAYQPSVTTFTSPITQASSGGVYQSAAHSVYANAYGNYNSQQQQGTSHNHNKLNSGGSKDSQYDSSATTSSGSLATTSAPTLGGGGGGGTGGGLSSSASVNSSQTKSTSSNAVPKSTSSGVVTGAGTGNMTGGGAGNMTPILNHQYIMGQGVPYTFQQPMYSYEDLQLMQQRIPQHMPTTGYYDAALNYQTTGPATSLGGGRGDGLSGVQGVQGVQGAYTSMSDARFARNDSNASPVPSTMSQQTATQHQQPMMNPALPPGYAYFAYGGGIMPGGFQYGTPAIYPQIATAGNAGTNSGAYSTKPANYGSGYGGGASYDGLASAGPTGEYKGAGSGYAGSQSGKSGTSTGNNNSGGSSGADIGATMYAKNHVALGKVNSYEKQTFHSATPPPFSLTGSQSAGMPGGYGAPHLFISTMPHQLHQPLHQDGGSSSGQRSNASSQNKAQAKPGYSSNYWTAGN